jgi:hypothetical protein
MTMEQYVAKGGAYYFLLKASYALKLPASTIALNTVKEGSVILGFSIASSGSGTLEEQQQQLVSIKSKLDNAVKTGDFNVYDDAAILNFKSDIVSATAVESCSEGQYIDSVANICADCPDDCPNCLSATQCQPDSDDDDGANLGAILGGVLGGLALITVIIVLVVLYKKGTFGNLKRSQSPNVAKYNLAESNPTSPDAQKTVQTNV